MPHRAKKRLGQNFLVDSNVIAKIIDSVNPHDQDHIIEIGPGLGALTRPLLQRVDRLDVIELDRDLLPELRKLDVHDKLCVHHNDVLEFDFTRFRQSNFAHDKLRLIGNLPYNISTPVLFQLMNHRASIQDMHFMLQKEVVERMCAGVGAHDYGRLSVMMQLHFETIPLFTVAAECFKPIPKVESAVVRLIPRVDLAIANDHLADFSGLVRQAFSQRRKTLKNTLKGLCDSNMLEAAGIDSSKRPQQLSVHEFIALFRQFSRNT